MTRKGELPIPVALFQYKNAKVVSESGVFPHMAMLKLETVSRLQFVSGRASYIFEV